jgi:CO dehydrogenase nickel-insertion accessory protein CooC1
MEDILVSINDNVDIIESWFVGSRDCRCPITKQINDAVEKLISRYDFVIFDCEFDLKYLNQLVDTNIDLALIVANPTIESVKLVKRISEFSSKYAAGGQMGIVLNKVQNENLCNIRVLTKLGAFCPKTRHPFPTRAQVFNTCARIKKGGTKNV